MDRYPVFYNNHASDGLENPRTQEAIESNSAKIQEILDQNWSRIEQAGILEGLTLTNRYGSIGACTVMGPFEKIESLKQFLEANDLGTVVLEDVKFRSVS